MSQLSLVHTVEDGLPGGGGGDGVVGEDSGGGGGGKDGAGAEGVGVGEAEGGDSSGDNLSGFTTLPLLRGGGGGSLGGGVSLGVFGLGGSDLRGVLDGGGGHGQVGAGHAESGGVGDVVDSLEQAVGVDQLVGAGDHTVGVLGLSPSGGTAGVSERILSKLVLGMELVGLGRGPCGVSIQLSVASTHASCQNNQSVHVAGQ